MRIAIFHDVFDQMGGAENLSLQLAKHLNADIITTSVDWEKVEKFGFRNVKIIEMPLISRKTPLKQMLIALSFLLCDFRKDYDFFIISGRFSALAAAKHKPNLYICVDILREFYDLNEFYSKKLSLPSRFLLFLGSLFFRPFFETRLKSICKTIAISENNREKIMRYYSLNSTIINPPIDCSSYSFRKGKGYWLSVNRLYPAKRIELQLEAFKKMPEKKLVIVTDYSAGDDVFGYVKKIKSLMPDNAELVFAPNHKKLRQLYSECEGFIATSKDEAFGMAVVEAMASGKPVVAVNEGAFKETVLHGKTGMLVEPNASALACAVRLISKNPEKYREACIKRAANYDSSVFFRKIKKEISKLLPNDFRRKY